MVYDWFLEGLKNRKNSSHGKKKYQIFLIMTQTYLPCYENTLIQYMIKKTKPFKLYIWFSKTIIPHGLLSTSIRLKEMLIWKMDSSNFN